MSKQIMPNELAEIVAGLLIDPALLGELDSTEKHQAFMLDIGQVVSDHCGGEANWINSPSVDESYLANEHNSPSLSVSPNDSLPSLLRNVWSPYDAEGWKDEYCDMGSVDAGEPMPDKEISTIRNRLQTCLLSDDNFDIPFKLHEKAEEDGEPTNGLIRLDEFGLSLVFDGYTDNASEDNQGIPIFIEKYENEINVRVNADVNREAPTHSITLSQARNRSRLP